MSLSSSDEVQTAVLSCNVGPGEEETQALDAQEDREIVGFSMDGVGINPSESLQLEAEAYVGSDPTVSMSDNKDIGGKFYAQGEIAVNNDETNGVGWAYSTMPDSGPVPEGEGWDWNEDVTLSLHVAEGNGSSGGGVAITVYYREV